MPLPRRAIRWLALGMAATLGLTASGELGRDLAGGRRRQR
jgi:hypothetical protein